MLLYQAERYVFLKQAKSICYWLLLLRIFIHGTSILIYVSTFVDTEIPEG